jgi:hypothetical protein
MCSPFSSTVGFSLKSFSFLAFSSAAFFAKYYFFSKGFIFSNGLSVYKSNSAAAATAAA